LSDKTDNREENKKERKPVEVYAERAETKAPEISQEEMQALASAYAKYLAGKNLKPGEATFVEPEEIGIEPAEEKADTEPAGKEELKPEEPETVEEASEAPKEKSEETEKSAEKSPEKSAEKNTEKNTKKNCTNKWTKTTDC
jgi:hypothetical protein